MAREHSRHAELPLASFAEDGNGSDEASPPGCVDSPAGSVPVLSQFAFGDTTVLVGSASCGDNVSETYAQVSVHGQRQCSR
jgi:hypothetical protein